MRNSQCFANQTGSYEAADGWAEAAAAELPAECKTYTPGFLVASAGNGWLPRVCSVTNAEKLVGLVYAKEKTVGGCRTGLIYADGVLGNLVAAEARHSPAVLAAALSHLLRSSSVRGIRLSVPAVGYELDVVRQVEASLPVEATYTNVENHSLLPLPPTYEGFLASLGNNTRRNFRHSRRLFDAHKYVCVADMDAGEFERAANTLLLKEVVGASRAGLKRALALLAAVDRPIRIGLRTEEGVWLAVLGGWSAGTEVVAFMQMNDERNHPQDSLALVLRSFLIENLIENRMTGLIFWAGVGGLLAKYTVSIPTVVVYLDKTTLLWRLFRKLVSAVRGRLPARLSFFSEWIVASTTHEPGSQCSPAR